MHNGAQRIAFDSHNGLGLCKIKYFAAQYPTPHDCCVRFAAVVTGDHATLARGRLATALPSPDFHRLESASFAWRTVTTFYTYPQVTRGGAGTARYLSSMTTLRDPLYAGYRYPAELISYAVWLYFRFPLGLRMVEEMLAARGISVTYETIRQWGLKFGREFARSSSPSPARTLALARG